MKIRLGRPRLGELLLREGIVDSSRLRNALERQRRQGGTLGTNLLELDAVREKLLLRALGRLYSCPTIDAAQLAAIPPESIDLVPRELAQRLSIVPFGRQQRQICIAGAKPDVHVENETTLATSSLIRTHVALEVRLRAALHRYYGMPLAPRLASLAAHLDSLAAHGQAPPDESMLVQRPRPIAELLGDTATEEPVGAPPRPRLVHPRRDPQPEDPTRAPNPASSLEAQAEPPPGTTRAGSPGDGSTSDEQLDIPALHAPAVPQQAHSEVDRALAILATTDDRDTALEALLRGCRAVFERVLAFQRRAHQVVGWDGLGEGVDIKSLGELSFDPEDCPPFAEVDRGGNLWLGTLPEGPTRDAITAILGSPAGASVLLALRLGSRTLGFVYLDNAGSDTMSPELLRVRELIEKAESAFARAITRKAPTSRTSPAQG